MAFNRFRPTSHFIAPHSWSNDPCGAVYIPEIKEYIFCYQWNPGTTQGGNCAWGMARSSDLVTWRDCSPAIQNGSTYDALGVFSGSVVSRMIEGKTVLFLFYTSISALPIHWSVPYLEGCESQSLAVSTDFGATWHRYQNNPILSVPPNGKGTTGWRDPFVSRWPSLSTLLSLDKEMNYMMIATGERGRGSELHMYKSDNLLDWEPLSTILGVEDGLNVSPSSELRFGKNFECASFFSIGNREYIILGIEEDTDSKRHNGHYNLWMSGDLTLKDGKPSFTIRNHGILDSGVTYAPHVFRDAGNRILQLGWADETASPNIVKAQGWAGCLTHPRELYEISKPISDYGKANDLWWVDEKSGKMTTLGIRPANQVSSLRTRQISDPLQAFQNLRSKNFEVKATFGQLTGTETFTFNILQSPTTSEVTKIILDLRQNRITVDRSHSSIENLGTSTPDFGTFHLLPKEDLNLHFYVDESIIEVYANDRFAMTSRVYPSLDSSIRASYDFAGFDEKFVKFELWEGLKNAWPERREAEPVLGELHPLLGEEIERKRRESMLYFGKETMIA